MNLFMMCRQLNRTALTELPDAYYVRCCRKSELDIWKAMPFDDPALAEEYKGYMTDYFCGVYQDKGDLFFQKCLFACDEQDTPVGTCFIWKAYETVSTLHWLKVVQSHEGKGLGRALLSIVMKDLPQQDYPVYLHTQPSSFRAIKLYSDFGFSLLSDLIIGGRKNDLPEALPLLKAAMPQEFFDRLKMERAPEEFLSALKPSKPYQF